MSGDTEDSTSQEQSPHEHCFHEIRKDTQFWVDEEESRRSLTHPFDYYITKEIVEVCCLCGETNNRYLSGPGRLYGTHPMKYLVTKRLT